MNWFLVRAWDRMGVSDEPLEVKYFCTNEEEAEQLFIAERGEQYYEIADILYCRG